MWHYTEGITNYDPIWPDARHPHPARAVVAVAGRHRQAAARAAVSRASTPWARWSTSRRPARTTPGSCSTPASSTRSSALSGQEQNPDLTGRSVRQVLARVRPGAPPPVQAFVDRGVDFVSADSLRELVSAMNDGARRRCRWTTPTVEAEVTARDREVANRFTKDSQITAIRGGARLPAATGCQPRRRPAPADRPEGRPADRGQAAHPDPKVVGRLGNRPGLAGAQRRRQPCSTGCTRRARRPASAAAACTATARWRARSSAAASSPAGPRAGRRARHG